MIPFPAARWPKYIATRDGACLRLPFSPEIVVLAFSLLIRLTALAVLLWLAVVDVRTRRLPVRGVLVIAMLYAVDAVISRTPIHVVLTHAVIAGVVFAACAVLFFFRMLGGGDAKLAASIFLWAGLENAFDVLLFVSVIGTFVGILSVATLRMKQDQRNGLLKALSMFSAKRGVPYGVALALGGGLVIVAPAVLAYVSTR
ncbi:prepilin peptidase [Pararobbsia alpina]|uniref:A24 family peptidase n=1 Tax=Pararobbsia alpina TaxID=621374 RepID=UPI0039A481CC